MGRFQKLEKTPSAQGAPEGAQPTAPPEEIARQSHDAVGLNEYPEAIGLGDEAFYSGDYRLALRHYSRALQAESGQVYPWVGQLNALLMLRQFKEADVWTNRALELFPEEPTVLSQRARVFAHMGDTKRAIGVSDYAMTRGSTEWVWLGRGEVLLLARNPNSRFCFEKAVEMAGKLNWQVPFLAGLILMGDKNYAASAEFLAIAAERNVRHAYIWEVYANVLAKLNFMDRARDAGRRAAELNPRKSSSSRLPEDLESRGVIDRLLGFLRR